MVASASLQRGTGTPLSKQDVLRGRRRRGYDPNDERYYVSDTNTGPDGSQGDEPVEDGREGSVMLSLLHQRVTKGSRRRPEVNNNNNNTDVNNFNNHEEKRKGTRVEGRRDERMRSEEKGGRRSAEERERGEASRFGEEKGGRQIVEEHREERG